MPVKPPGQGFGLACLLALTLATRLAAFFLLPDTLLLWPKHDPDSYGRFAYLYAGFPDPNRMTWHASAFRPPAYPLVLAPIILSTTIPDLWRPWCLAALHLVFAAGIVILTCRLSRQLAPASPCFWPGLLIAVNPILIHQSTQLMTETFFTLVFLWAIGLTLQMLVDAFNWRICLLTGLLQGLLLLTRPPAAAIWLALGLWILAAHPAMARRWLLATFVAGVVVAPWVIRNQIYLGKPILGTTHAGYTLYLGQNQSFFETEIQQGLNWSKTAAFELWQKNNEQDFSRWLFDRGISPTPTERELLQDEFFFNQASAWIKANLGRFFRSIIYHLQSFFGIMPRVESRLFAASAAAYAVAVFLFAGLGLFSTRISPKHRQLLLIAILALAAVHAIYWSNQRFRAPLEPLLAILAVAGAQSFLFRARRPGY